MVLGVQTRKNPVRGAAPRLRTPMGAARPRLVQRLLRAQRDQRVDADRPRRRASGDPVPPPSPPRRCLCSPPPSRPPCPPSAPPIPPRRPSSSGAAPRSTRCARSIASPRRSITRRARRARTASARSPRSCSTGSATRPGRTASAASSIRGRCAPAAAASSPSPATARSPAAPAGPGLGAGAADRRRGARRTDLRAGRPLDPLSHQRGLPVLGAAAGQDRGDRRAQFLPAARRSAARRGAFNAAYAGSEPLPRPAMTLVRRAAAPADFGALARRPAPRPGPRRRRRRRTSRRTRAGPRPTCPNRPSARNIASPASGATTPRPRVAAARASRSGSAAPPPWRAPGTPAKPIISRRRSGCSAMWRSVSAIASGRRARRANAV